MGKASFHLWPVGSNALSALPAGVFDGLTAVHTLNLRFNALGPGSLEDGVFEPLTELTLLILNDNSGSASFVPRAASSPAQDVSPVFEIRVMPVSHIRCLTRICSLSAPEDLHRLQGAVGRAIDTNFRPEGKVIRHDIFIFTTRSLPEAAAGIRQRQPAGPGRTCDRARQQRPVGAAGRLPGGRATPAATENGPLPRLYPSRGIAAASPLQRLANQRCY